MATGEFRQTGRRHALVRLEPTRPPRSARGITRHETVRDAPPASDPNRSELAIGVVVKAERIALTPAFFADVEPDDRERRRTTMSLDRRPRNSPNASSRARSGRWRTLVGVGGLEPPAYCL